MAGLTKDKRIRRRATEREAIRQAGVAAFVLAGGNLSGEDMARAFVRALPRMRSIARRYARPLIAVVTPSGRVTVDAGTRRGGLPRE